ncbi:MAG: thiamine phosphate synthase, partial [Alkalibacterium sp.]|nr:thiamine phosphate synthase [Alkalibacterium sp.]
MKQTTKEMLSLYFIAGTQDCKERPLQTVLEEALKAGITCFQFREKGEGSLVRNPSDYRVMAQDCQILCKQYGVPFIVNDDVKLARELKADGIHVGQDDTPVEEVIEQFGADFIIGLSTNSVEEYLAAQKIEGLDYAGIGPAFTPQSKDDHEEGIGLEGIRTAMKDG